MLLLPGWAALESRSCLPRRRWARQPLSRPTEINHGLGRLGARRPQHPGLGGPGNSRTPAGCRRSCRTAPRHLPHSPLSGRCATGSRPVTAEEERRQGAATGLFRPRRSTPGWGFPSSPACSFWMASFGVHGRPDSAPAPDFCTSAGHCTVSQPTPRATAAPLTRSHHFIPCALPRCALHLMPYALHLMPYALHLMPYTLRLTPKSRLRCTPHTAQSVCYFQEPQVAVSCYALF